MEEKAMAIFKCWGLSQDESGNILFYIVFSVTRSAAVLIQPHDIVFTSWTFYHWGSHRWGSMTYHQLSCLSLGVHACTWSKTQCEKYVYNIIQTLFSLKSCSVYIYIKHNNKDYEPSVTLSAESNKMFYRFIKITKNLFYSLCLHFVQSCRIKTLLFK